jgi:SAM-dependent methyltransferase
VLVADAATIRAWERAEVERSQSEASAVPPDRIRPDEDNLRRYLDPPATTPHPLEYAFHLLGDLTGRTVLDYGCGDGENLPPMVRRGARVIGLELSDALIGVARKRLDLHGMRHGVHFLQSSAHDIALPDNSVDIVLGIAILHHLDLGLASREVHRVLRPGGRAIFQEPVRDSKLMQRLRRMVPYQQKDVSPYERPLTEAELRQFAAPFSAFRSRAFWLPFVSLAFVVPALQPQIMRLSRVDRALLDAAPFLGRYAGIRVFEVTK